jgi:hypothetical protein
LRRYLRTQEDLRADEHKALLEENLDAVRTERRRSQA